LQELRDDVKKFLELESTIQVEGWGTAQEEIYFRSIFCCF
jgi:hypothetical protein